MTHRDWRELDQLLAALVDGQLTSEEHARLQVLLGEPENRRRYLEYMDLHAGLLSGHAPIDVPSRDNAPTPQRPRSPMGRYVALVVVTFVLSLFAQFLLFRTGNPEPPTAESSPSTGRPAVTAIEDANLFATLAQTHDCRWEGPSRAWRHGSRVGADELRLAKGLARIRFDSGAELLLEGPTTVRVESAHRAVIHRGKVVFRGDQVGTPFELETPLSVLVDLGTEFGVWAAQDVEEIHVFDGEVRRTARGDNVSERLTAGEARRYTPSEGGQAVSLDEPQFVRRLPEQEKAEPDEGLLAYESFDYESPDALATQRGIGGRGWIGGWHGPQIMYWPVPGGPPLNNPLRTQAIDPRGGLTHPGRVGAGGSFQQIGQTRYSRQLASPIRLNEDATYYLSFLFRRDRPPRHGLSTLLVSLKPNNNMPLNPSAHHRRLALGIGSDHHLCVSLNGSFSRIPLPLGYGATYLLVAKIVGSRTKPCEIFVRVYSPDEAVEREETPLWTHVGRPTPADLVLEWVEIYTNGRSRQQLDELRIGTTWHAVIAPWTNP